ncbi:tol-pal system protein YbgF [Hahella sp. KA22]|uniref:tol-pal system protein YbgF n=1 Tax=Hahella sp. KA22 TaxID=1628392 RepID=UPI000FDE31A1|nr:tol-pal system protein YbgF [Hahella sp. KA22]AZZ91202.1 tol-pal system protein YbgF [Hahella sp. KA22]QAY54570.1 tol-pal system protein YbgF [Hahella sp. KA22]
MSKKTIRKVTLLGVLACGVLSPLALAASSTTTPVLQVRPAQQPAPSAGGSAAEMLYMFEQMQQEVRELRGQVEELRHQVDQMKKQERERYIDLDRRILELQRQGTQARETRPPVAVDGPAPTTGVDASVTPTPGPASSSDESLELTPNKAPPSAAEQQEYDQAFDLIKRREYDKAVEALHAFIKKYPESELSANAYYWLGEVYLVIPKLEQARQAFVVVVGKYPEHRKAPDAMYKLGVTYHRLGDNAEAKKYLSQTVSRFPGTSSANLAKDYLRQVQ